VTNGLISLIEQNRVSPSVSSLKKVLDGIPMALADFFTLDLAGKPQVFFPREELARHRHRRRGAAAGRRPPGKRSMSILHERYAPNADTGEEMLTHAGEEGGVIVKGKIELSVGGESRVLGRRCVLFQEFHAASLSQSRARGMRDREREFAAHVLSGGFTDSCSR
jgi:transcriptional regulator with XRE-family HTH domain